MEEKKTVSLRKKELPDPTKKELSTEDEICLWRTQSKLYFLTETFQVFADGDTQGFLHHLKDDDAYDILNGLAFILEDMAEDLRKFRERYGLA